MLVLTICLVLGTMKGTGNCLAQESPSSKYQVAGIGDDAKVGVFLSRLKRAVAQNDKKRVADLVHYPVFIGRPGGAIVRVVKSKNRFIRDYGRIICPRIRAVILAQKQEDLFVNDEGFRMGQDDIWFGAIDDNDTIRILQVNCAK